MTEKIKVICEMEITLKMIGGKYKPIILELLLEEGAKRFGELQQYLKNISTRSLTNQLRELENDGLISRKVFAAVPPKVEYNITEKGKSLEKILELMCDWGYEHKDSRFEILNPQCSGDEE